ncbi:MAG: DUF4032 domain-containing protein [Candidatus Pacebacteria bacterium]|nr:DUF4032 domain-containing protein [Candidatus Paceibacterota bacterium]
MDNCKGFDDYMAEQKRHFCEAVEEEKWYLSERAGTDVGFEEAMNSFLEHHVDDFAHTFRVRFCREQCPYRETCELAVDAHRLAATRTILARNGKRLKLASAGEFS